MLHRAFLISDADSIRPLAQRALQCILADNPPVYDCVREWLEKCTRSPLVWELRLMILLALNHTDSFAQQIHQQSPLERDRLVQFMTELERTQWNYVRGRPPVPGSDAAVHNNMQHMTLALSQKYIMLARPYHRLIVVDEHSADRV